MPLSVGLPVNDPIVQLCLVGIAVNLSGAAMAFYLWSERRDERYLLFWGVAWTTGLIRWVLHYPAEQHPTLRAIEGLNIAVTMFFTVMGSYDLLPTKPWRERLVVGSTAGVLLMYGIAANAVGRPMEMGYGLFAAVLAFSSGCTWVAYRSTRLAGYAFAAATCLYELVVVGVLLLDQGRAVANSIIVPLFNIPLMLSVVVIAYQRHRRQLTESERTLHTIFETAPAPIVVVRAPRGEFERANPAAFEMLGLSPATAIGRTALENGIILDPPARRAAYAELESGQRINARDVVILRAGREERTVTVNANRIALDSGDRFIFSFYDLTELRRVEAELRASAEEMRVLYVRLATVEDDERRTLHAELHDRVGANLSALQLGLDVAVGLLARNDRENAERHLATAREVAAETIAAARDLMAELRPPALDDYGLVAAIRTFAESQSSRLALSILVAGDDLMPRPTRLVEGALFRIAHESVINAACHAHASRVTVTVCACEGRITLMVEDDGVGFDLAAPGLGSDHWGLKSMRERAQGIGAILRVDTAPGAGTRVTVETRV